VTELASADLAELALADLAASGIDASRPHAARMYDYYIGGKNHFAADRAVADAALASWKSGRTGLRENRRFLGRAVRYLAAEAGIRQFLDIGSGLPTTANVHEMAQDANPSCRVVYVAAPCLPPRQRDAPPTSRPTCGRRSTSCRRRRCGRSSTSASRSRSCCSRCCTSSRTRTSR
jgi:hypothetical protein